MELINTFDVSVPIEMAWKVLTDVERIAPCLPGAQLQEIEGNEYRGIVKVKVGPIQAQYKGKAIFIERDDVNFKAVLDASGRDTRGQGNASATITAQLEAAGDKTHVTVTTDLTVTGKVAQFGRGVLADVSAKILTQFVDNLEQTVLVDDVLAPAADAAAEAAPAAAPAASAVAEEAPTIRKIDQPEPEAIDLLQAGSPVLKRAVPVLGVAIGALIVYGLVRRRRRK
ncbi:MAG: SRPBCC family protein [Actinobacteria bacterium]|nr:SRPBCC family protein [Actinomycetota bacterium]